MNDEAANEELNDHLFDLKKEEIRLRDRLNAIRRERREIRTQRPAAKKKVSAAARREADSEIRTKNAIVPLKNFAIGLAPFFAVDQVKINRTFKSVAEEFGVTPSTVGEHCKKMQRRWKGACRRYRDSLKSQEELDAESDAIFQAFFGPEPEKEEGEDE